MTNEMQEEVNHHDVKQWQHCSLFNLDLFNDENDHLIINKDIINKINIDGCSCSLSTPNVEDSSKKDNVNHICSFSVLQKNYTTQLEHVAKRLLSHDNNESDRCYYCSTYESNDTKIQSLNRKILLGSTAILDSFLRNSIKSSSITNSNNPPSSIPTTTDINLTSTITASSNNPRRWHSERGSRQSNFRANLPLTIAQRQVLERYINNPRAKTSANIRSTHRSHHRQPITGKVVENTGTALSALTEQTMNSITTTSTINNLHNRKNSLSLNNTHSRQLSSNPSSTISHHNSINRHCFLVDTIEDSKNGINNENESVSSSQLDENHEVNDISILSNHHKDLSEKLSLCVICYELKCLQKRPCCNFYACSTCLNIYVEQKISQGIIRIQCPNQQCRMFMHPDEIHKRCISPELHHKFTQFLIDNNRSVNIKTCPRCSNIHEIGISRNK